MALTAQALSALVFADHLALFPSAVNANRQNVSQGVPLHNVPEAFIGALCEGLVVAALAAPIFDIGAGTLPVGGVAPPAPVLFPGAPGAVAQFIATQGWVGTAAAPVASVLIQSPLLGISKIGLVQMKLHVLMGTGTGVVSPASNPNLISIMTAALATSLPAAFQASGKFSEGDVPGAPINAKLAAQIPAYAAALATGFGSITAVVAYVGSPSAGPVAGVINSGNLI